MAIYHLHVKNISRSEGRSAVAAAAYRAGQTLPNEAEERDSVFGGRRGVVLAEIRAPAGVPGWMLDRAQLWNRVEAAERRKDARLAKEIEFALPRELSLAARIEAARTMADHYVRQGLIADLAIHDDGSGHNPHAHLLLTTRVAGPNGLGAKLRSADGVAFVHEARRLWAGVASAALGAAGGGAIDHRSHKEAGIAAVPTVHRGPDRQERQRKRWERPMSEHDRQGEGPQEPEATAASPLQAEPPVPDPEGRPITPQEQDAAERAMLAEMERPEVDRATAWWLSGDRQGQAPTRAPVEPERDQWWERER